MNYSQTGKGTKLQKNNSVANQGFGPLATDATEVPFWDDPPIDPVSGVPLGIDGPKTAGNPWDRVFLNDLELPGIWSVTATPSIHLDVQKPVGYDGGALIQRGYVPAGLTLAGKLWTPEQWKFFQRILPTFWRLPNNVALNDVKGSVNQIVGKQNAVKIKHPATDAFGIEFIAITQITPPEETNEKGVRQIKILAKQYVEEPQKKNSAVRKVDGKPRAHGNYIQSKIEGKKDNAALPPSQEEARKQR